MQSSEGLSGAFEVATQYIDPTEFPATDSSKRWIQLLEAQSGAWTARWGKLPVLSYHDPGMCTMAGGCCALAGVLKESHPCARKTAWIPWNALEAVPL